MKDTKELSPREYVKLLEEAHGCEMPEARSTWVGWPGRILEYDVRLPSWDVTICVPMPDLAVLMHLSVLHAAFRPELPREHAEFYIDRYQVRACDALSFALVTFDEQESPVRTHLRQRFGPMLGVARDGAARWWARVAQFAAPIDEALTEERS